MLIFLCTVLLYLMTKPGKLFTQIRLCLNIDFFFFLVFGLLIFGFGIVFIETGKKLAEFEIKSFA